MNSSRLSEGTRTAFPILTDSMVPSLTRDRTFVGPSPVRSHTSRIVKSRVLVFTGFLSMVIPVVIIFDRRCVPALVVRRN